MMVEAGLMRILVMDERVTERSQLNAFSDSEGRFLGNADPKFLKYTEQGEDVKDSIFELAWASGVHIATHYQINDGEQYPLSNRPPSNEHARHLTLRILTDSQDGKYGKIQVISNLQRANGTMYQVTDNHYDMILIHRTVLKQIQDTIKDSKVEFNFLRDIKDTIPFAVVDSGGGYPNEIREEFKSRFKFLPFSFMSEHLLRDRIAKVGLSQLLMGLTDAQQND